MTYLFLYICTVHLKCHLCGRSRPKVERTLWCDARARLFKCQKRWGGGGATNISLTLVEFNLYGVSVVTI